MEKRITCSLTKQEIIEAIIEEFDRTHALNISNPTERNTGRELAILDILKRIPIYVYPVYD